MRKHEPPPIPELTEDEVKALAKGAEADRRGSTWLMIGNGGALLLCLNAFLDHKICDWSTFRPIVAAFGAGVIAAFLSNAMILDIELARSRVYTWWLWSQQASKEPSPLSSQSESAAALQRWKSQTGWASTFFLTSAACLVVASGVVLFNDSYKTALCPPH